jgi:hypothetical protein
MQPKPPHTPKIIALITIIALTISPIFLASAQTLQLTTTTEYNTYVHTNINTSNGNFTQIDKPIFPLMINNSQIQVGQSWNIICPLQTGHNYHIYCYGSWINTSAAAKTDYDIYVYNPAGVLESSHTEAAGFMEHLGTTADDAFFTPTASGDYSFVVKNDERQSEGTQQATFMIIENLECDKWYTTSFEGPVGNVSNLHTAWAYEFVTNESTVSLYANVDKSLDMYEARLYLMNTAESPTLNGYPLPWEPGLYGNQSGSAGGYNFESEAYRGVAYASCEYNGQPMSLSYTAQTPGPYLYHLVLIAEDGLGNLEFMLKSKFGNTSLTALSNPVRTRPNQPVTLAYTSNNASLAFAQLSYTTNNWADKTTVDMVISNQTCNATIPGQAAGTTVQYQINAYDSLRNNMTAAGDYTIKQLAVLDMEFVKENIRVGENVTVKGTLTPFDEKSVVELQFMSFNDTQTVEAKVLSDGTFTAEYQPPLSGTYAVVAAAPETGTFWRVDGPQLALTVAEPPLYIKYSLYIVIGLAVAGGVGGAVWFLKFRNK